MKVLIGTKFTRLLNNVLLMLVSQARKAKEIAVSDNKSISSPQFIYLAALSASIILRNNCFYSILVY